MCSSDLGAGVLDRLVEQNYKVRGVQFGSRADNPAAYFNKRSEMWGALREWLRTASIGSLEDNAVKENKELKSDMTAPRYKISSSGSVQLESKGDMKKRGVASTDIGDSVALTLAYPLGDNILRTEQIKLWTEEIPSFQYIVQSYDGAYTEKTSADDVAGSASGVFENKGVRYVMLLDCWTEKIPYGALRSRMIKEWHSVYGPKNGKQRKPDVALVGHDGMSDAQITDLRTANIIVPTYKMGDEDDVERAHKAAAIVDEGVVFVPQRDRKSTRLNSSH
mgnify:FL=1